MSGSNDNNKEEQLYLRMTLNERIQHSLLMVSFITLVITGFALKFPESLWVSWFRAILGEAAFDLRGIVHRVAAVMMVGDSLYHVFYISFTKRGRQLVKDFWLKKQDYFDLKASFRYYLGKEKNRPKYGRFSYVEKSEYWSMVWGTIVMSMTGGVLWFENTFLPIISNSGMDMATIIHYYEAILATLAIIIWHLYFVIYNPDIYPMNKAWFTGFLTKEEMEHEHPLELEAMEADKSVKENEGEQKIDDAAVLEKAGEKVDGSAVNAHDKKEEKTDEKEIINDAEEKTPKDINKDDGQNNKRLP